MQNSIVDTQGESLSRHLIGRRRGKRAAPDFDSPDLEQHYPPDLELEPIHLDIDLGVDLANQTVSGIVTTTVRARRAGPTAIKLNAVSFQDISILDPGDNQIDWSYDGTELSIEWSQPFTKDEERLLAVTYRVEKPTAGLYFSRPDQIYPHQAWFAISDHETERARHWLPCIDLPNVRTSLSFHLRSDARFTILANGYLEDELVNSDGSKTAHWKLHQLCPSYLICIAIGEFTKAEDGIFVDGEREIPLAYFCSPEHSADDLIRTFGRTKEMLDWMTARLGMPFPYPKYYQIALPGVGGAMENISLVSWSDAYVQDESLAQELGWRIDQVNVHELSHSYFGDAIVCRDFAHAWLKESWATYIEQCWREDYSGDDEALYVYYTHAAYYFAEADEYMRPIVTRRFKSSWDLYDAHLYEGGACRLHTLRHELGDETFWAAVRDYLNRFHGGVVETDDFRAILEEHSGRSLGKFFDQWFRRPGYPHLEVTFQYDTKRKQGEFTIEQKQVDRQKGITPFELSTDIGWSVAGVEYHLPLTLDQERHVLVVAMPDKPDQVRFDPGCKALHKLSFNPGAPLLRKQLTDAKDVIGRIQAAVELAKTGKRSNLQSIIDAYTHEPFWGVRCQFATALANTGQQVAADGLALLISQEQDPMVLSSLLRSAAKIRDTGIRDAVAHRLEDGLPYLAAQAAYETLGAQRKQAPWDLLSGAIEEESFNGIRQSGAFRGLAATRRPEAIDLLAGKSRYGSSSNRSRPAAVSALAVIGKGQEKAARERLIEQLVDLLRDPWPPVQWAAAHGLRTMDASEAITALDAFGRGLCAQERTEVERLIKDLRSQDKVDGSALKKQVEDLQEKVKKLEDRIQKLDAQNDSENGKDLQVESA